MRRPSTIAKERVPFVRQALGTTPYRVTDRLRVLEDRLLERRAPTMLTPPVVLREQLSAFRDEVVRLHLSNIAVVDDAVDSGATLACVMTSLRMCLPSAVTLRSCAITRTRSPNKTLELPDYVIYENTLCRFFWSYDFHGPA